MARPGQPEFFFAFKRLFSPTNPVFRAGWATKILARKNRANFGPARFWPIPLLAQPARLPALPLTLLETGSRPKISNQRSPQSQNLRYQFGLNHCQAQLRGPKLLQKTYFLQIQPTGPISKKSKNKQLRPCPNLQTQTQMRKTLQTAQPSFNKMKICATDSHTLPLSNGNINIFKSLCSRECTGFKPPKYQIFNLTIERFEDDTWTELIQLVEESLKLTQS